MKYTYLLIDTEWNDANNIPDIFIAFHIPFDIRLDHRVSANE